ncbi:phage major capsid protein [Limosilactobacillus antri]|uniref:phage major capsid protein n=1 Tax=Limosilactobacillus antri TaxID=227943 RepID=UPI001F56921B|nr:phage major capsid protein [Limosilactobacillus antri]
MIATNNDKLNIRTIQTENNNLRAVKNNDGTTTLTGYAVVFNQPSKPIPFVEYISCDAFDNVDLSDVLLLYAHDYNNILARADSNTLKTTIDDNGLKFEATLPNTTLANDVRENINAGNLKGCSFGFTLPDDGSGDSWATDNDGTTIHYVNHIKSVSELTITPIPAYSQTSVQVERDLNNYLKKENNKMQPSDDDKKTQSSQNNSDESTISNDDLVAAIKALGEKVDSLFSDDRDCVSNKRDDDDDVDSSDDADDDSADVDEEDDASESKSSPSDESDDDVDADDLKNNRSITKKEEKRSMINITPNNSENDNKTLLRDFAHYLVTREMRPSLQRDAAAQGVGLTQGSVLIPETILAANHETHQFPRLEDYVHSLSVTTTTGKQPYFEENTGVLQTKEEFASANNANLSALKFINWDLKTYAGKLALSRELLMDSSKGSSENWLAEAQSQMWDLQDNTNDSLISAALLSGSTAKNATDAIADLKTILNVNLKPQDSANSQIVLTQSAYNALDQLKDNFGRPLLQPDPTSKTSNLLLGKSVVTIADTLLGKAGEAIAVVAPLSKVIYDFQMGQVTGQFVDNFDIFDTTLGVFLRKDVVNGRPDLVNILKLTDKSLAASDATKPAAGK